MVSCFAMVLWAHTYQCSVTYVHTSGTQMMCLPLQRMCSSTGDRAEKYLWALCLGHILSPGGVVALGVCEPQSSLEDYTWVGIVVLPFFSRELPLFLGFRARAVRDNLE